MWPDLSTHLKMRQDFPDRSWPDQCVLCASSPYSAAFGPSRLPSLGKPLSRDGTGGAAKLVIINPRQSSLTENPTVTYRDAPLPAWHAFIDAVA